MSLASETVSFLAFWMFIFVTYFATEFGSITWDSNCAVDTDEFGTRHVSVVSKICEASKYR